MMFCMTEVLPGREARYSIITSRHDKEPVSENLSSRAWHKYVKYFILRTTRSMRSETTKNYYDGDHYGF